MVPPSVILSNTAVAISVDEQYLNDSFIPSDWAQGVVEEMPSNVEYVPMFWGPQQTDAWNVQKPGLKNHPPRHLMAFNEPDVAGESNMDPSDAAQLYMQEIQPFSNLGTQLGSPAIVWNADWMDSFLKSLSQKGGHIDFMCIHWSVLIVERRSSKF
jgi:hypothetical protein